MAAYVSPRKQGLQPGDRWRHTHKVCRCDLCAICVFAGGYTQSPRHTPMLIGLGFVACQPRERMLSRSVVEAAARKDDVSKHPMSSAGATTYATYIGMACW